MKNINEALRLLLIAGLLWLFIADPFTAHADVLRDDDGRIHRDHTELAHFKKANPCPATGTIVTGGCKGFVIDHKIPLCAGGADAVDNLQWQGAHESKIKDKYELQLCSNKITLEAFKQMWLTK